MVINSFSGMKLYISRYTSSGMSSDVMKRDIKWEYTRRSKSMDYNADIPSGMFSENPLEISVIASCVEILHMRFLIILLP